MEKNWLAHYPKHVPHEINPDVYRSINHMFDETLKISALRPAASCLGVTINYKELHHKSMQFASFLQNKLGMKKGNRIAIMMPNVIQFLIAMYGALRAGLTVVNVNPLYTERELEYQLCDAQVDTIVVLESFAHTVELTHKKYPLKNIIITKIGDMHPRAKGTLMNIAMKRLKKAIKPYKLPKAMSFRKALRQGARLPFAPVEVMGDDLAFLQYTGGTTGVSKGAMLSHRNMVANVEQAYTWISSHFQLQHDRALVVLPLYHVFSLLANALIFLRMGSECVLVPNARDINSVVEAFKTHRCTTLMGVNTLFNALLAKESFRACDFSELKIIIAGGMALQEAVAKKWHKLTGAPIVEGFGLTEMSPITCINPLEMDEFNGAIGLPVSSTEAKIVNDAGEELPMGEAGELCFRGPQVMQGYWRKEDETDKVMLPEGWLRTGDIATMDEKGYVFIVDRKKDMIDVAGYNVYPNEVEDVLMHHPAVKEVAVVGIPNRVTGEMVKAFVVTDEAELNKADLVAFCKENLVSYKIPRRFEQCAELPKNTVGKVLRRVLRDQEAKEPIPEHA
jgi:long-chain acyl-CoA synthetase